MLKKIKRNWLLILFISIVFSSAAEIQNLGASPLAQNNGDQFWQKGDIEQAISVWKKEALTYDNQKSKKLKINTLSKIARGYISLGQFYDAITELEKIIALSPSNSHILAVTRKRLGNAYSGIGKFDRAIFNYQKSLNQEKSLYTTNNLVEAYLKRKKYNEFIGSQINSKSNATQHRIQAEKDHNAAIEYGQIALSMAGKTELSSVRALINWNNLSPGNLSRQQLNKGEKILENLPYSRNLAFTMLNWADLDDRREYWLEKALNIAKALNDDFLKSYVYLELGAFYEKSGNQNLALDYAQKAQLMAQSEFAYDSLYRAQHLSGRIYQENGDSDTAIHAYQNAIATLNMLLQDSVTISIEQRRNFKSEIEPIYRETLNLLLDRPGTNKNLAEAIAIYDKLRLAQLQNYFGDDCFEIIADENKTHNLNKNTAQIYSIILEDKTLFILELPNGKLIKSELKIPRQELISEAEQWYEELKTGYTWKFLTRSQFFYEAIIKPFEAELNSTKTLIFINDGILRNLPMAALSNGDRFLVQDWAVISSLGNFITPKSPKSSNSTKSKALIFGLSDPPQLGWKTLSEIPIEVSRVQEIMEGKKYMEQEFTLDNLTDKISNQSHSILHLATHGYFGGTAEGSFLLAYDEKISTLDLENSLLSSPQIIDLLVLSACETAVTNELSLLGLAGTAARSGVSSTLGSLWQVQDEKQREMIEQFYLNLNRDLNNKAWALQRVQIQQIDSYAHPIQWAALSLIGNL